MIYRTIFLGVFLLFSLSSGAWAKPFDFSAWGGVLEDHHRGMRKDGVSYTAIEYKSVKDDKRYSRLISDLVNYDPVFENDIEKMAFWINAYNLFAVKIVIDNPGIDSIRDAGSFFGPIWKKKIGNVGGDFYSLDQIEHKILRPMGDARIHLAIVCASVSCPDIRKEAYTPEKLDKQLNDQAELFFRNHAKGLKVLIDQNIVYVSKIFYWFKEDFQQYGGVRPFVASYLDPAIAKFVKDMKNSLVYFDYNWKLNGVK